MVNMASPAAPLQDQDIVRAFRLINEDLTDKTELLDKCLSMCHQYSLTATDLANNWEAFSMNNSSQGQSDSSQSLLNLSSLGALESTLHKKSAVNATSSSSSSSLQPPSARKSSGPLSTPGLINSRAPETRPMFNVSNLPIQEADLRKRLSLEGTMLMSPPATNHKRPNTSSTSTPSPFSPPSALPTPQTANQRPQRSSDAGISPASQQSPAITSYDSRTNSGQRITGHNLGLGGRGDFAPSSRGVRCVVSPRLPEPHEDINLTSRYRFMYTTLEERAKALESSSSRVCRELTTAVLGPDTEVAPVGQARQETVVVVGRICCEAAEGRLNKTSVLLEGSRRDSGGCRVKLDLSSSEMVGGYALFPGQVVAVEGVNASGHKMVVKRVVEGVPRPFATTSPSLLQDYHHSPEYQGGQPLSIMTASGPYTTVDNLDYSPLEDLLQVVATKKPDVLILMGPFVDCNHPSIASGEVDLVADEDAMETVDVEALFKLRVSSLLTGLFEGNPGLPTKIVLVPSLQDVAHDFVFPQPPLSDRIANGGTPSPFFEEEMIGSLGLPPQVLCLSNPCLFTVNEVVIGVTTNDILLHLSSDEISAATTTNRLARLAAHLVHQQSFYPLFPPPAEGLSQLDMRHAHHWSMPITPDVLLVPSKLAPFIKPALPGGGCLAINPGQSCKATSAGSYAYLDVHPLPSPQTGEAVPHAVSERTMAEVLRL